MWHNSYLQGNRSEWDNITTLRGNNRDCSHKLTISTEPFRKVALAHHLKGTVQKEARGHHLKGTVQHRCVRSQFKGNLSELNSKLFI
jgi:hypothetical protein